MHAPVATSGLFADTDYTHAFAGESFGEAYEFAKDLAVKEGVRACACFVRFSVVLASLTMAMS
jgi:hypothetical protein